MRRLAPLVLVLFAFSCSRARPRAESALGTLCSVNLYEWGAKADYDAVFARFREIQKLMAFTRASGGTGDMEAAELDLVNLNAGISPVAVHGELLDALEEARRYAELSGGAFDPTIGPLAGLWGIGGDDPRVPAAEALRRALDLVDWRDLVIDRAAGTVFLRRPGQALDLGALAKGYAADEAAALLRRRRDRRALIDLGGNILVLGEWPGRGTWRVGVQDPLEERGIYLGILNVRDKSVVTSGVYERYFEEGGRRYHHILSTEDGYPVENGLLSVTVVADRSTDADALSTACFALGPERGLALVEALPDTEAIFVDRDRNLRLSSGAAAFFTLTGEDYRVIPSSSSSNTR
jgi:thiamine biosynthesis lipoprotein